jgi:GTP-binding protein Era
MKQGTVLLLGRPNVGKSTFVNAVIGEKIAITSPKPQTTRFPIRGVYRDDRGEIIFIDTPGIFDKAHDELSQKINRETLKSVQESFDIVVYMVDHTRKRDMEEAKVLGIVRKIPKPKILVINKIDFQGRSYMAQYRFLQDEFQDAYQISALKGKHLKPVIDRIFELLPENKEGVKAVSDTLTHPILNMDSRMFLCELIREKVFLMMGDEIPYTTTAVVDEVTPRNRDLTFIKARILTTDNRYKRMLIGAGGRKIKEIGAYARKEIELATKQTIYLDLTVEVDKHWQKMY